VVLVIITIYRAFHKASKLRTSHSSGSYLYEKRMILFFIWSLIQQIPGYSFYFQNTLSYKELTHAISQWVGCFATSMEPSTCSLSQRPSLVFMIFCSFAGTSYAFIGTFAFGLHEHVYRFWWPLLVAKVRRIKYRRFRLL
jgi:hypothetical protein